MSQIWLLAARETTPPPNTIVPVVAFEYAKVGPLDADVEEYAARSMLLEIPMRSGGLAELVWGCDEEPDLDAIADWVRAGNAVTTHPVTKRLYTKVA